MQEHQLKPNRDSSAIAYVDEMNPYGTHWDWTFFPPSYCTQRLKQRKINKGKQSKDTLQIEIKASFHREILAILLEVDQIQTQIIVEIIDCAFHITKDEVKTS